MQSSDTLDLMSDPFQVGLDTFGDVTVAEDATLQSHASVLRDVLDEAVLADQLGLDAFGVGEHHRADFAISAPEVVLAATCPGEWTAIGNSGLPTLSSAWR